MISWVIFGIIIGSIAYRLQPNARGGFVGSLLLGLLGTMDGGFLAHLLVPKLGDFHPILIFFEILGACLVLGTQRILSQIPQRPA